MSESNNLERIKRKRPSETSYLTRLIHKIDKLLTDEYDDVNILDEDLTMPIETNQNLKAWNKEIKIYFYYYGIT